MLSRINRGLAWATVLFKNSVAASLTQSAGFNQTPLNLANVTRSVLHPVSVNTSRMPSSPLSYPARNSQTNIDGVEPYLEYIFAAVLAVPAAIMVYFGIKRLERVIRGDRKKPHIPRPAPFASLMQKPLPTRHPLRTVAVKLSSADQFNVVSSRECHANEYKRFFEKKGVRQATTQTIRDKLRERQEAAEVAKKMAKPPVSIKVAALRPKLATSGSSAVSSVARVNAVLKVSPPASVSAPVTLPNRKTLQAQLELVRESAMALATFSEDFHAEIEEKRDAATLRTQYLLGMYRLHRYNLSVLELMCNRPAFHTKDYAALIVPLRREFAHFSSEVSLQDFAEMLSVLQNDLANFLEIQSSLSSTSLRSFIESMSQHFLGTAVVQRCLARLPEKKLKIAAEKNHQAHTAYEDFVNSALPELKQLAEKIIKFNKASTKDEQGFSYDEYMQAFGMLVMESCDRLPVHVLISLRNSAEKYPENVLLLMSRAHHFRNTVAHRLETLPPIAVLGLCLRIGRVCGELQNKPVTSLARRDSLGSATGRLFGVGKSRAAAITPSIVAVSQGAGLR